METSKSKYNNKVITWSKIATILFIALVAVCDATALISAKYICYCYVDRFDAAAQWIIASAIWAGTIAGYVVLVNMYKLLTNMSKDVVFEKVNTKLMNIIFWGLIGAGVCALIGCIVWLEAIVFTAIAWFIALVVLAVKICFDKAIAMKEELDLTI